MIQGYADWMEYQANVLFANVAGFEMRTLERIGKRIKKYGRMSLADIKTVNNIAVVKEDMDAIVKDLAQMTDKNIREIYDIYGQAIDMMHSENRELYDYRGKTFVPFEDNRELQALVRAYAKVTGGIMINLAKTTMLGFTDKSGKFSHLQKAYTDVLDKAVMSLSSGSAGFYTAMRDSIVELGGSGLRTRVQYDKITRRLDTVVRQHLLWGAKQASNEYYEMIGDELGCDGIEIDWHSNPRPSHEFMQGKQYALGGAKTINGIYFESAGKALEALEDYGCLHYKVPIICGISEPRYDANELAQLNAQNAREFEIDGKKMTGYEASQAMRRLETEVRKQKDIRELARASGDKFTVKNCNERIKAIKAKYTEISNITGIPEELKRMSKVRMPKDENNIASPGAKLLTNTGSSGIIVAQGEKGELAVPYSENKLPDKIKEYIKKLPEYGSTTDVDEKISFEDIALLSRQTGVEFASVSIGDRHMIIRGDVKKTPLPEIIISQKGILNCHSHPHIGEVKPSPEDLALASKMPWQDEFIIVSPDGKIGIYNPFGIIQTKNIENAMTTEEGIALFKKIFEEG